MKARFAIALAATVPLVAMAPQRAAGPEIRTSDVERFYALYDSMGGKPSAEQLQAYIDGGTDGFRAFTRMRNTTGGRIAQAIEKQPEVYVKARQCANVLPAVKTRLATALARLKRLYPEAVFAPVTLGVGRGKPVGTADRNG